jgi:hypothetical protein
MLDIGLSYYDALTGEDGTLAPFALECQRRENGSISVGGKKEDFPEPKEESGDFAPPESADPEMMKLAGALSAVPNTCEGQITAGVWAYIAEIRNRRLLVIDKQKGLAVGFSNLYHDSKLKTMKLKVDSGEIILPAWQVNFNMPAIHFFKIKINRKSFMLWVRLASHLFSASFSSELSGTGITLSQSQLDTVKDIL